MSAHPPGWTGLTREQVRDAVNRVSYWPGWNFRVVTVADHTAIQVKHDRAPNWGRCWIIEERHDASDVIRTVYLAIKTHEAHERREGFMVDGKTLWNPHERIA